MDPSASALGAVMALFGDLAMFVAGIAITVWVVKSMKNGKSGSTPPWTELLTQLSAVSSALALTAERLGNLPTRAEIMGGLRGDIRHDVGDKVAPVILGLGDVHRAMEGLAAEIRHGR